jgi:hypothetical protein
MSEYIKLFVVLKYMYSEHTGTAVPFTTCSCPHIHTTHMI